MSRKTNDNKMLVFIGGPMNGFMDNRYPTLKPSMTFVYFPKKNDDTDKRFVTYQFAHFQDDTYYYEFVDAQTFVDADDEDDDNEYYEES